MHSFVEKYQLGKYMSNAFLLAFVCNLLHAAAECHNMRTLMETQFSPTSR